MVCDMESSFLCDKLCRHIRKQFRCAHCPALNGSPSAPLLSSPLPHPCQGSRKSNTPSQTPTGALLLGSSEPFLGPSVEAVELGTGSRTIDMRPIAGLSHTPLRTHHSAQVLPLFPSHRNLPHLPWRPSVGCGFTY